MSATAASAEVATAPAEVATEDIFVFDTSDKAIGLLEDVFAGRSFKIIHTKVVFPSADEIKGKCSAIFVASTQKCSLEYDFKLSLKFAITFEGKEYRGWILLVHMNEAKLRETDFAMEVRWDNGISPKGIVFNQTNSVLLSPRCREAIREGFRAWESATIDFLLPKMLRFNTVQVGGKAEQPAFETRVQRDLQVVDHYVPHHSEVAGAAPGQDAGEYEAFKRRSSLINKIAQPLKDIGTQHERRQERKVLVAAARSGVRVRTPGTGTRTGGGEDDEGDDGDDEEEDNDTDTQSRSRTS